MLDATKKKEMLQELLTYIGATSAARFAQRLGISPQQADYWLKNGSFNAELLKSVIPELSGDWLLTGRPPMIRSEPVEPDRAFETIAAEQRMAAKAQDQADRMLALIENLSQALKRLTEQDEE